MSLRERLGKARTWIRGARWWIVGGLALLALAAAAGAVWHVLELPEQTWADDAPKRERLKAIVEFLKNLAQVFTPLLLLVGIIVAFRRIKAAEDQAAAALRQAETAEEGQITDRFTKAIEHIGKPGRENLAIRLGGIYALERIARDSKDDHWTVMEVLCAFLRENFPRPTMQELEAPLATDARAICDVLRRRKERAEPEGLNLAAADLHGGNLVGVNLRDANLHRADLSDADLTGADLNGADLSEADLNGAHLNGAHLRANLSEADLSRANLFSADLNGANLFRANLSDANLHQADLSGAYLICADLSDAELTSADLSDADLTGADLNGADLSRANFHRANLQDAKHLTQEQLKKAMSWE